MISFAQNHEDVVLARAFDAPSGFYIDVGAASPSLHSVTKHFYDRGWRGVNVEPVERWHGELEVQRPRDVNILAGAGEASGTLELFDVSADAGEEATFSPDVAERLRERGFEAVVREVPVVTLAEICEAHVDGPIDFLKVDVEGWELPVLRGGEWERFRPRVVVVESTRPGTAQLSDDELRTFLQAVGYDDVLFDGVNRFYVRRDEDDALREALSVPANALDGFVSAEEERLRAENAALDALLQQERAAHRGEVDALRDEGLAAQQQLVECQNALEELPLVRERLARAQRDVMTARREARDAELQFRAAREALERQLAG